MAVHSLVLFLGELSPDVRPFVLPLSLCVTKGRTLILYLPLHSAYWEIHFSLPLWEHLLLTLINGNYALRDSGQPQMEEWAFHISRALQSRNTKCLEKQLLNISSGTPEKCTHMGNPRHWRFQWASQCDLRRAFFTLLAPELWNKWTFAVTEDSAADLIPSSRSCTKTHWSHAVSGIQCQS